MVVVGGWTELMMVDWTGWLAEVVCGVVVYKVVGGWMGLVVSGCGWLGGLVFWIESVMVVCEWLVFCGVVWCVAVSENPVR